MLGNGLNRVYGGNSWTDLIGKIAVRKDFPTKLTCPYPLQAVLATNDHVKKAMVDFRNDFFGSTSAELREQIQKLLALNFDDVLTTNYSYEIEASATSKDTLSENYLKKTCQNVVDGEKAEPKYLIHTCQAIPFNGHTNRIWHIHGEARKPNSMILGQYYYATLLYKMVDFAQKRRDNYQYHQKENTPQTIRSWIDSFILGDVYILGFGMDFSEIDLWWLLNRKKRERANHGCVYYYSPGGEGFDEKEELLKQLGVQVIHCGIPTPEGTDEEKNLQFRKFYQHAINDIKERMINTKTILEGIKNG